MENLETQEQRDAEQVNEAIAAIQNNRPEVARRLLEGVVIHTPSDYVHQYERDGTLVIKFWNATEFMHYVATRGESLKQDVVWQANAYPQAYYYLAFLAVRDGRFPDALALLDRGERLEPNPHFLLERAQVYQRGPRDLNKAEACYERVLNRGAEVPANVRAVAMRGLGFIRIETGDLDRAEQFFRDSLELDPESKVAINELEYIAHLRAGGRRAPSQIVSVMDQSMVCEICGSPMDSGGRVGNIDGRVVYICSRCLSRHERKWWQFWKWF